MIRGGNILEVGNTSTLRPPPDARVIDLSGRTVLPGYVMLHEHLFTTPDDKLVARRVAITSTLTVFEGFVSTREPATGDALELMAPEVRERYQKHRAEVAARPESVWSQLLNREMKFEREFARSGGLLVAGTDPTGHGGLVAGFSNQRAIELLVGAGFSTHEAIRIATLNGARYLGRDDRIGTIAPGKQADLVVVLGDPEDRLSAIEQVETVFKKGVGYDSRKLRESVRGMVGVR